MNNGAIKKKLFTTGRWSAAACAGGRRELSLSRCSIWLKQTGDFCPEHPSTAAVCVVRGSKGPTRAFTAPLCAEQTCSGPRRGPRRPISWRNSQLMEWTGTGVTSSAHLMNPPGFASGLRPRASRAPLAVSRHDSAVNHGGRSRLGFHIFLFIFFLLQNFSMQRQGVNRA